MVTNILKQKEVKINFPPDLKVSIVDFFLQFPEKLNPAT